jgi:TATA-box binding protein (TBP) (component of TFIID and TFIIIB)
MSMANENEIPPFNPSAYKISTITATGSVNTEVNLDILFDNVPIISYDDENKGVVYAEFGSKKSETIYKGYAKKLSITHRKKQEKKRFDNQVTLIFKVVQNGVNNLSNVKVFRNGNVQITGLKTIPQGVIVIDDIILVLRNIYNKFPDIVKNYDDLRNSNYQIRLINCDFKLGFEIKRDKLHKLIGNDYNVSCRYEPCIYPGVAIQYNWNQNNVLKDGICKCNGKCTGKGSGSGDGNCKRITIAVFQSGCIIITGGQTEEQIQHAYDFICTCIKDNIEGIYKKAFFLPQPEVKKKKIYIKKSSIIKD